MYVLLLPPKDCDNMCDIEKSKNKLTNTKCNSLLSWFCLVMIRIKNFKNIDLSYLQISWPLVIRLLFKVPINRPYLTWWYMVFSVLLQHFSTDKSKNPFFFQILQRNCFGLRWVSTVRSNLWLLQLLYKN